MAICCHDTRSSKGYCLPFGPIRVLFVAGQRDRPMLAVLCGDAWATHANFVTFSAVCLSAPFLWTALALYLSVAEDRKFHTWACFTVENASR